MKLLKILSLSIIILAFSTLTSCKKDEGAGGQASIIGKIWVKKYNVTGTVITSEYAGAYEDVYIIYGDDATYGDRIETNFDGIYEFKYLRPGKYTIYSYSSGGTVTTNRLAVAKDVEITDKKQTVDAGIIYIAK